MSKILELLDGKKTYLLALGAFAAGLFKYFVPEAPVDLMGLDTTAEFSVVSIALWAWKSATAKAGTGE